MSLIQLSKYQVDFEVPETEKKNHFTTLVLTNLSPDYWIGYKIKSTNNVRYIVSPASAMIDPLKDKKIDIVL